MQAASDADTDIVCKALASACTGLQPVAVYAEDTDILVMFVYHYQPHMHEIYFVSDVKVGLDLANS
jgi:hypothetical protein